MRGYWPKQTDDTTGVTDYLNRVAKYVVSSTIGDPGWEHTTVLRGNAIQDEVRALKSKPGKDIVATGSITLVHALIAAGLVDVTCSATSPRSPTPATGVADATPWPRCWPWRWPQC